MLYDKALKSAKCCKKSAKCCKNVAKLTRHVNVAEDKNPFSAILFCKLTRKAAQNPVLTCEQSRAGRACSLLKIIKGNAPILRKVFDEINGNEAIRFILHLEKKTEEALAKKKTASKIIST